MLFVGLTVKSLWFAPQNCIIKTGRKYLWSKVYLHSCLNRNMAAHTRTWIRDTFFFSTEHLFFFFFLIGGYLLYNIVVVFVIHWHESATDLHVFPIPIPPPTSLSTGSLCVFPVHQPRALVSCIPPGLVICFTLDKIHVSMLFSWNIPPSPSPTESKRLFYTSVSLFLFCI